MLPRTIYHQTEIQVIILEIVCRQKTHASTLHWFISVFRDYLAHINPTG